MNYDRLVAHGHRSAVGGCAACMFASLAEDAAAAKILECGLQYLVRAGICSGGGLIQQAGRQLGELAWHGTRPGTDADLESMVTEALDKSDVSHLGGWTAVSIPGRDGASPAVLLLGDLRVEDAASAPTVATEVLGGLADLFAAALAEGSSRETVRRRTKRLQAMIEISARWTEEEESDALLEAIAEAATVLFRSERASIFLWDRERKLLVGRPALGVEGNSLEVSDSAGIVGAVLHSGDPKRWYAGEDGEAEVNRSVDEQLQFQTRSLLAVPLWDSDPTALTSRGKARRPIGVFELINGLDGAFRKEDEHELAELAVLVSAAIRSTQKKESLHESCDRLVDDAAAAARVIGNHPSIETLRETSGRVAATDLSVLILGENGTGKEVLARSIHFQSPRKHHPFIAVNCAALVESLLESELFGHEKGAFTDAHQTRPGKFEAADGGTLFLDEIGDLSQAGQAKLLRVLEERKVVRVGGSTLIPVDVRVIAATNQPLAAMVREKKFREDLFFRLNVVTIDLPPLRDRGDDVILLAEHFLTHFANQLGRKVPTFTDRARHLLMQHAWPGNIRELRNLVERVTYLCSSDRIDLDSLDLRPGGMGATSPSGSSGDAMQVRQLAEATREFQAQLIESAIVACSGNMTAVAESLGIQRSNLYRKMRQLGVDWQKIAREA